MDLLERDDVLRTLEGYAEEARGGDPRFVLVAGEAGVGKTSLLEALRLRLAGVRWLWGACDGSFTPEPLAPLFDVARATGGPLAEACLRGAPREQLFRLLLDELGRPGEPAVLAVEDVHWADEATLDLLRFVGRRLRGTRALVVVTYRDDALPASHPLRVLVGDLATQRGTRRAGVAPLSPAAVARLAAGAGWGPGELYELTGGNPFYVTEVLAAGSATVPESAAAAVLARAGRLSAGARRLLDAAAVLGARPELDVLLAMVPAAGADLDACLAAGVLVAEPDGYRFRHELTRLAVEQALPLHQRVELHGLALAALAARGGADDARLAHHAEGAGDEEAVLRYALPAARRASALAAHVEAATQYERASRFADGLPIAERARLYDGLARENSLVDQWEAVLVAEEEALRLWREAGDQLRVGDTLRSLARTYWRLCRGQDAAAAGAEALRVLEALPPGPELAWTRAQAASREVPVLDADALERAVRARRVAEDLAEPALISYALNTEGCLRCALGDPAEGLALLRRALAVALRADDDESAGRAFANLQAYLVSECRFDEADQVTSEGLLFCEDHDLATYGLCLRGGELAGLLARGRWDRAERRSRELLTRQASPVNTLAPLTVLAVIEARRGAASPTTAGEPGAGERAAELAERSGEDLNVVRAGLARLEAAWLAGDTGVARAEAAACLDRLAGCDRWSRGEVLVWVRRLRSGAAPATAGEPERLGVAEPHERSLAGDHHGAAAAWAQLGCPYEQALALLDADDVDAVHSALALFDGLGARPAAAVARAALRRLGVRAIPRGRQPRTRADALGLTPREREVLELVGENLTNADIAARLVISEKTVDHHVSAVLAKLGVASRRDAARALRADLGTATA